MGEYSFAVACELTEVIKNRSNCPTQSQEPWNNSCSHVTICFWDLITPQSIINYFNNNVNVFNYCSEAACDEYWCNLLGVSTQFHLPLNTTVQDLIVNEILAQLQNYQNNNAICDYPTHIVFRKIEVMSCYNGAAITCSQSFLCTNMSLRLKVTYTCCSGEGEGS